MEKKFCTKCGEEKTLEEFRLVKRRNKYSLRGDCRQCEKKYRLENGERFEKLRVESGYYQSEHRKEINRRARERYKKKHKDRLEAEKLERQKIREAEKLERQKIREAEKLERQKIREAEKAEKKRLKSIVPSHRVCTCCGEEKLLNTKFFTKSNQSKHGLTAQCKECIKNKRKEYRQRPQVKEMRRLAKKNRKRIKVKTDPIFKTKLKLRKQVERLKKSKSDHTFNLIGCSPMEFWQRNGSPSIKQLKDLHIDHIIPLSWFDLENDDHVKVSSHWTNLQYLNAEDNLNKSDNYAGRPDSILGYKDEFNIDKHVKDMIEFIDSI